MVVLLCKAISHLGGGASREEVGHWAMGPLPDPLKGEQVATRERFTTTTTPTPTVMDGFPFNCEPKPRSS